MSLESLDRIKKAEEDARKIVEQSRLDAAAMIKNAESEGETFLLSEKSRTQKKLDNMMNEAKLDAEKEIFGLRKISNARLEELRSSASAKLADAVESACERIMNEL